MGYYIDLSKISIDDYRDKLKTAYLPPSRMELRNKLDERFGYFKTINIKNIKELIVILKKKDKFAHLQKVQCLSGNYLTLLLRELNSLLPKPSPIRDFKGITKETIAKLEKIGIKNTVKLFDRVINPQLRKKLAEDTNIPENEIIELTKLTDLSRIRWVGTTFAQMLYNLGFDTLEKVSKADANELHEKVNQLSKEKSIYKGHIGLNDIKIVIDVAKEVPLDIQY